MQTRMSPCLTLWSFICQCKDIVYDHPDMFVCAVFFFNWNGHSWIHASISKHFFFVCLVSCKLACMLWSCLGACERILNQNGHLVWLCVRKITTILFLFIWKGLFFFFFSRQFSAHRKSFYVWTSCVQGTSLIMFIEWKIRRILRKTPRGNLDVAKINMSH